MLFTTSFCLMKSKVALLSLTDFSKSQYFLKKSMKTLASTGPSFAAFMLASSSSTIFFASLFSFSFNASGLNALLNFFFISSYIFIASLFPIFASGFSFKISSPNFFFILSSLSIVFIYIESGLFAFLPSSLSSCLSLKSSIFIIESSVTAAFFPKRNPAMHFLITSAIFFLLKKGFFRSSSLTFILKQ